jgi:uncharacterized membrane protein
MPDWVLMITRHSSAHVAFDIWPLGFVALVPLRIAARGSNPEARILDQLAQRLRDEFAGLFWLVEMLRKFSGFPAIIFGLFALVVNALKAGRMGAIGRVVRARRAPRLAARYRFDSERRRGG